MFIDITIVWKDGTPNYTTTRTVNTQADLTSFNTQLEQAIKELIDSKSGVTPTPTPTPPGTTPTPTPPTTPSPTPIRSRNQLVSYTG